MAEITIRAADDSEEDWRILWPMLEALEQHHQPLTGLELRANREERLRKALARRALEGPMLRLLAFADGEPAGTGFGRVRTAGWSGQERIGSIGDLYVVPEHRGANIIRPFHRLLEDFFRGQGVAAAQRETYVDNDRAYKLWQYLGYLPVQHDLERKLAAPLLAAAGEADVRRVRDVDAEWDFIRPLLQGRDEEAARLTGFVLPAGRDSWHRQRIEQIVGHRGRLLIASLAGRVVGMAVIRVSTNPWIFIERRGVIDDLIVASPDASAAGMALLRAAEAWFAKKGAHSSHVAVLVTRAEEVSWWISLGYRPYLTALRKEL